MKDEIAVKGFRFQVYCGGNGVHIHSPEETVKVDIETEEAQKLIKPFMAGLGGNVGSVSTFSDLKVSILSKGKVQIQLGKEKAEENRKSFIESMQDFRKLVEED